MDMGDLMPKNCYNRILSDAIDSCPLQLVEFDLLLKTSLFSYLMPVLPMQVSCINSCSMLHLLDAYVIVNHNQAFFSIRLLCAPHVVVRPPQRRD